MKNNLKKIVALLVIVATVFALAATVSAFDGATAVTYDQVYYDSITSDDKDDYYSFSLGSYSKLTIGITTTMRPYKLTIYDSNKKEVWSEEVTKKLFEEVTDDSKIIHKELDAGNYFLKVSSDRGTGSYNLKLTYVLATKVPGEVDTDDNHKIENAKEVALGKVASGKLLEEKERDYYKLTLNDAGTLDLKVNSNMRYYTAVLYKQNADGVTSSKIWSDDKNEWDSSKKSREDNYKLELSKGVYFLEINGFRSDREIIVATGNYSFTPKFTAAGTNEVEPNNSIVEAKKIAVGTTYTNHLSLTDGKDFFEVNVNSGTLAIGFVSNMSSYNIYVYDESGKEKWSSKNNGLESEKTSRSDLHKVDVGSGKYYIRVDGGQGKYSFLLDQSADLGKVANLKYSKSVTYVTLKWKALANAQGYEVFKYDEKKKEYVKVGSTTKNSLKIKKLSGGTNYKFMVKAYKKINTIVVYGEEAEIVATTVPSKAKIKSVKAGATGSKQATVTWAKVVGATGYRIYYSVDRDFETVKKVTVKDGEAVSKTIKKLKKGKKYYFRVRAYKKVDGKNLWGKYSNTKSVKIK